MSGGIQPKNEFACRHKSLLSRSLRSSAGPTGNAYPEAVVTSFEGTTENEAYGMPLGPLISLDVVEVELRRVGGPSCSSGAINGR